MYSYNRKGLATVIAVIIIVVILVVAALAGIYIASSSHSVSTTTVTTGSTVTTTTTASSSGSASSAIPSDELIIGQPGSSWGTTHVGDDVMCDWGLGWYTFNYEQLFEYDPYQLSLGNYVPIPWLASNYTESANGLTYTINLRQGVHFHSGDVMTSADVVYSMDRFVLATNDSSDFLNCPGYGLDYRSTFASWANVTATGTYQVTLKLNYPDANILQELANQGMSIYDSKLMKEHTVVNGTGPNATSDWGFAWLDAGPQDAGTGPYQLTAFTYEQRVQMQAFSDYWGGPGDNFTSNIKTVIVLPFSDPTTAQFALQDGQINMVQDETPAAMSAFASTPGYSTITSPSDDFFILWPHMVGPMANWEVRDAIKEAINYTQLTSAVTNGYAKPDDSLLLYGMQGFNTTTANYYPNQGPNDTGAKALLKEAGYPNGFTVNIYTRPSTRYGVDFVDLCEVLQSDLAAVNITLNIQVYVVGQFYDLAENLSLPGIWTVPANVIIDSPNTNIAVSGLGPDNPIFIGWNASTETGPNVPFTQLETLANESNSAPTVSAEITALQQLDPLYLKYGPTTTLFQINLGVAYPSYVKGVIWDAVFDQVIPYNLET